METDWPGLAEFFLICCRMTSFMVSAPFFALRGIPPLAKVGSGLLLAVVIFPIVSSTELEISNATVFVFQVVQESLVGLALGYTATLALNTMRLAGQFIDLSMGFYMVSLMDPASGSSSSVIGQFLYYLGILLFLVMDGHHSLLAAICKSYDVIPLCRVVFSASTARAALDIFAGMFSLAFRIALPVVAVLVISDICLGLVARTVPQLNVFILGFPLKAALGLVVLSILAPLLATVAASVFGQMERDLVLMLRSFR